MAVRQKCLGLKTLKLEGAHFLQCREWRFEICVLHVVLPEKIGYQTCCGPMIKTEVYHFSSYLKSENFQCSRGHVLSFQSEQEILGRTDCFLSFHYIFSIWYDTNCIGNIASNSSVVSCIYVAMGTCLPSCCLAGGGGGGGGMGGRTDTQTHGDLIRLLLFFKIRKVD
jgi:hypothetical protein